MAVPIHRLLPPADAQAAIDFPAVRAALGVPTEYPADAVAEARRVAAHPPVPDLDRTDLPLVTIDPPGSMDLDQAMHLEKTGTGYRVHYAIADVASFVEPGAALDAETHRRGQTLYSPDLATPLHPTELSEGAASLLPDEKRSAVLWTIDLDASGAPVLVDLRRALVRSVARFDYAAVQADADSGRLHPSITALPEIGRLREQASRARHAITLNMPDAEVSKSDDGHWTLALRAIRPVEDYNAEISLLTGMCAAKIMLDGRIGLLRTLPPPNQGQISDLRRSAAALGIPWPQGAAPGDVVASVDAGTPKGAAFLEDAVHLLRGAGYTPFDGAAPAQRQHAGVGAPYAHVTAPLRRLADRFATEVCLALRQRRPVPEWARNGLAQLPDIMSATDRQAADLERACMWAVTEFMLAGRVGELFSGTVVQLDRDRSRAVILLEDPPVRARCASTGLSEGSEIKVRLVATEAAGRTVVVEPVIGHGAADPAGT